MHANKLIFVIFLVVLSGCANKQAKDDTATAPQKQEKAQKTDKEVSADSGGIVGKPASGSKFSKIKIGMSTKEVIAKIGHPDNEWRRPTGKAHIPFYFGDDRWVIEYSYHKEGKLTFNSGGERALTGILVDTSE
ncbi:MAG: hypothetical protein HY935_03370 [Nitrosomonadales bacterium]|nr:hypothetical protein [Nitrosomonadales bacterium]